jgi:hypothetical protein
MDIFWLKWVGRLYLMFLITCGLFIGVISRCDMIGWTVDMTEKTWSERVVTI